ncbi:DUF4124 domain-containing protein [Acidithiobacillus sp. M4-SHS-6]|uniref:DUF4124 domain-containing protein n=1 Tax=Acidithiobacillus sp. M4-SHS-6 TaxID=3383024 RepID=UPI0039BE7466
MSSLVGRGVMLGLLLTGVVSMQGTAETIYRWVGSNGVLSYGENPPAGARGVEQIAGAPQQSVSTPAGADAQKQSVMPAPVQSAPAKPEVNRAHLARKRLEVELAAARLQLLQATHDYQEGKAIRTGNERNYVRYLQRVNALKQAMDSAQLRVLLLQHQLEQLPEGPAPSATPANRAH